MTPWGNVENITDNILSGTNKSFTYDDADRLQNAEGPWGSGSFIYDHLGNLVQSQVGAQNLFYQYDTFQSP